MRCAVALLQLPHDHYRSLSCCRGGTGELEGAGGGVPVRVPPRQHLCGALLRPARNLSTVAVPRTQHPCELSLVSEREAMQSQACGWFMDQRYGDCGCWVCMSI